MTNKVSKRLKMIRNVKRFSRKEFAEYLDVSPRSYEKWEQGIRLPDTLSLVKIADRLKITTDWLLGRTDYILVEYRYKDFEKYFKE